MKSESKCLVQLKLYGEARLSPEEIYRALVFSANSGILEPQAQSLDVNRRLLLEARVLMSKGSLAEAAGLLKKMQLQENLTGELVADVYFLLGINAFRRGDKTQYLQFMERAKLSYLTAGDEYRTLRAAINLDIVSSSISSFECGHLKAFAQESVRQQYFDLAGNIFKAEALERFKANDIEGSLQAVKQALKYYEQDGCPEDSSLTQVLCAILLKLKGHVDEAQAMAEMAKVRQGKVHDYWMIWSSLKNNQEPQVNKNHQLAAIQWKQFVTKARSITQRIVQELKTRPMSKNEVIGFIWGEDCLDPSYESRFFSAMQQIKKGKYLVQFDGEKYKIS